MRRRWMFATWLAVCAIAVFLFVRDRSSTEVVKRSGESAKAVDADGANLVALAQSNEHPSSRSSVEPMTRPDEVTSLITPDDPHEPLLRIHVIDRDTANDVVAAAHAIITPESAIRGWVARDGTVDESARGGVRAIGINGWIACTVQANVALHVRVVGDKDATAAVDSGIASLVENETRILTLELPAQRDRTFCGQVVSAEDGSPIANAVISLPRRIDNNARREGRIRGDDTVVSSGVDGRFRVRAASDIEPTLEVVAAGFVSMTVTCVDGHETIDRELKIPLHSIARLVVHAHGGSAKARSMWLHLEARSVDLFGRDFQFQLSGGPVGPMFANPIGERERLESNDLPSKVELDLRLFDPRSEVERSLQSITLRPGETRELDVDLDAAIEVSPLADDGELIH